MIDTIEIAEPEQLNRELPIDRPRKSGFIFKPIDHEAAIKLLQSFYDEDPAEQRETFELLRRALDEGRAARGERLLYEDYE